VEKKSYTYSLVDNAEEDHIFVNGNTKTLAGMNQQDLKVLFKNGDARVKREENSSSTDAKKPEPKKPEVVKVV
jgi:hypothetical protein